MLTDFSSPAWSWLQLLSLGSDKFCGWAASNGKFSVGPLVLCQLGNTRVFPLNILNFCYRNCHLFCNRAPTFVTWFCPRIFPVFLFCWIDTQEFNSLWTGSKAFPDIRNCCHSTHLLSAKQGLKIPAGRSRRGQAAVLDILKKAGMNWIQLQLQPLFALSHLSSHSGKILSFFGLQALFPFHPDQCPATQAAWRTRTCSGKSCSASGLHPGSHELFSQDKSTLFSSVWAILKIDEFHF